MVCNMHHYMFNPASHISHLSNVHRSQTHANLLYKAVMPSVCSSIRIFLVEWISAVDARINVKLEAPILREHKVCF